MLLYRISRKLALKIAALDHPEQLIKTLKSAALIHLVESGVIRRNEDGELPTEAFENFWASFETTMMRAVANEVFRLYARWERGWRLW